MKKRRNENKGKKKKRTEGAAGVEAMGVKLIAFFRNFRFYKFDVASVHNYGTMIMRNVFL